jgi:hypothetical protein
MAFLAFLLTCSTFRLMFDEYYKFKGSSLYIFLHTNFVSSFLAPKLPTFNKHHRFAEVGDIYFATPRRITFWIAAFFLSFHSSKNSFITSTPHFLSLRLLKFWQRNIEFWNQLVHRSDLVRKSRLTNIRLLKSVLNYV